METRVDRCIRMEQTYLKCVLCNFTHPFDLRIQLLRIENYCSKPNRTAQNMTLFFFINKVI
jgi:hypothetical protein